MAENFIQKAIHPSHKGRLHRALHVPLGEKIPEKKIEKAEHSKNEHLRHMAALAETLGKLHKK